MSDDAALAERQAKAAARQAKLLAKSQERLAKITGAAKGEGRVISDAAVGIQPRPPTTSTPPAPRSLALADDPAEIDLASMNARANALGQLNPQQQAQFNSMFGGGGNGAGGADPMAQMMAQLMGGAAGGADGAAPGPNMFANMMNASGGGMGGAPGQPPVSPFPPQPKTFLDRIFPLVHLIAMVGLSVYAICYMEPARKFERYGWMGMIKPKIDWAAWARLSSSKPITSRIGNKVDQIAGVGLSSVPLLWMFVSVELLLQTTRVTLLRNRASAPSILNSVLPLVSQFSPQLGLLIGTLVRYFALVSVLLTDLSVVVFCVGLATIVGTWKVGGTARGIDVLSQLGEIGGDALDRLKGEL